MCRLLYFLHSAKTIAFLFFCFLAAAGFAQPNAAGDTDRLPGLRRIEQTKNFWPPQCTGMVQDSAGFIWISTLETGLFRYDGKNLKQYKNEKDNPAGISSNSIKRIFQDSRHKLWLFYKDGGFDVFDPFTEKVRHLSAELEVKQKIAGLKGAPESSASLYFAHSLYEDVRHRIWVVAVAYVALIDEAGKGSIRFFVNTWAGIPNSSVLSINETAGGHLLIVTKAEIAEADANYRIIRRTPLPPKAVSNAPASWPYNSMSLRKGDTLYAACPAGVVMYFCKTGGVALKSDLPSTCLDVRTVVSAGQDRFLFYDTASSNHLYEYATSSGKFTDLGQYHFEDYQGQRYFGLGLIHLYDRFGNLWHGGDGLRSLYQSTPTTAPFIFGKYTYNGYWQVLEQLWHVPVAISRQKPIFPSCPMVVSPQGALYFITPDRKLSFWIPSPWGMSRVKGVTGWQVMNQGIVGPLYADNTWRDGKLWVYDYAKRELFTIDTLGNSTRLDLALPPAMSVNSFATTENNTCWMTFNEVQQLALYQPGKGFIKIIRRDKGKMPLPNDNVRSIFQDKFNKHIFWVFTNTAGLLRFNEEDETWQLPTKKDADHPSHNPALMMQDWLGYLWYNHPTGIYRFDSRMNKHQLIVSVESLPERNFSFETPVGEMFNFFGNEIFWGNGTNFIDIYTDKIKPARDVAIALTGLRVNNQEIEVGDSSGLMTVAVNALPELRLAHDQNFLHFGFTALEYNQPAAVRYRYQLEGIDKTWVESGTIGETQYTSLPWGHYTLKVNATNEDGEWSREVKTLRVVISPPWWRTWWAYTLYVLLAAGAGYVAYRDWLARAKSKQQVILKQKEAEQAQAMEETKSRFFANITHELRTPLTLILSPVQKQLSEGANTYSAQLLQGVYQNSKLLLRLINQLLDMSKLEGGNMQVTLSRGNLGLFIEGILTGFRQQAAARSITLSFHHGVVDEECLFDADKLEKILYNLLSNAFKFTPDGSAVTVRTDAVKEANNALTATISVADSGIGISPEHLPRVFDRFYQVNTSTTRRYEGTGIGLSLVKELAELMGGGVKAESTEGAGSVFTVSLPMKLAAENETAPAVQYQTADETLTAATDAPAAIVASEEDGRPAVLVVEDNEGLRRFIAESLAPHYRVLTAVDGAAGLQTAGAELPDLIISDVMMPVMDGYEFCQKIKEVPLTGHIGFVMLTAKTADESRLSGLRLGADHYLGKPFNVEELLLVISNLLKRQQALREHYGKQLQPAETLPPVNEVEDAFLRQVYSIIETNLDSHKLDVDFLASELAVSRRTLNRKLSAIADTSANEIIRTYRLKKAAALLLAGHNVSETAYATGFSTPSWFSQCFKEMYGVAPVQWAETGGLSQN